MAAEKRKDFVPCEQMAGLVVTDLDTGNQAVYDLIGMGQPEYGEYYMSQHDCRLYQITTSAKEWRACNLAVTCRN